MSAALQTIIVALLVIASSLFAIWRLTPLRAKLRLLDKMRPDTAKVWGRWIARLRKGVAEQLTHGCGACASKETPIYRGLSRPPTRKV
jgi:hypothetical protein